MSHVWWNGFSIGAATAVLAVVVTLAYLRAFGQIARGMRRKGER